MEWGEPIRITGKDIKLSDKMPWDLLVEAAEHRKRRKTMARRDIWAYDPDICDGDFCPQDCDRCPKADKVMEKRAEEEENGKTDL